MRILIFGGQQVNKKIRGEECISLNLLDCGVLISGDKLALFSLKYIVAEVVK